ncbi:unnamed protein product, partial [marine sediment metagenome]
IVTQGLAIRKEKQIKVRRPLSTAIVESNRFNEIESELLDLVKDELNVKEVKYEKANVDLEVELNLNITPDLRHEGWAREFARQIQEMRKEGGYKYDEEVFVKWYTDDSELAGVIQKYSDLIAKKTVLRELAQRDLDSDKKSYDIERDFDIDKGKKIQIAIRK